MQPEKLCVMFTDIKSSSMLWNKYPKEMPKIIERHDSCIFESIKEHKGMAVKTMGDSVMAVFPLLNSGIDCAIDIHKHIKKHISLKDGTKLRLRIGLAYGIVNRREIILQGHKLKDYFGAVVNLASRMESEVSPIEGIAVLADEGKNDILAYVISKGLIPQEIKFRTKCQNFVTCRPVEDLYMNDRSEHTAILCY